MANFTPATDDRVISSVRVLGTDRVRPMDTVRQGAELETRPRDHATVIYGIHEADEGHVDRTTCADPNCAADGFDSGAWGMFVYRRWEEKARRAQSKRAHENGGAAGHGRDRQGRRAQASRQTRITVGLAR
jgi:hypothetical protein